MDKKKETLQALGYEKFSDLKSALQKAGVGDEEASPESLAKIADSATLTGREKVGLAVAYGIGLASGKI